MWQLALGFISLLYPCFALAISSIHIHAETVSYDQKAQLTQAELQLDLSANTTAVLSSKSLKYQEIEAQNTLLKVDLRNTHSFDLTSEVKHQQDKAWTKAQLNCLVPKNLFNSADTQKLWQCEQGNIEAKGLKLPFSIQLMQFKQGFDASLNLKQAQFSDEAGLHAAEKLTGQMQLHVMQEGQQLRWHNTLQWESGEVFWQPFYISGGGHQFSASGLLSEDSVQVESGKLNIHKVGELNFSGVMRLKDYAFMRLDAELPQLDLATAYPLIFKPLLDKTAFDNAEIAGKAALKVAMRDNALTAFELKLNDVSFEDNHKKFAFYNIQANIPWSYDDIKQVSFGYESGSLLNLPLGKTQISAELNRYALTAPTIRLPILDGALHLKDVSAARIGTQWYWHLGAELTPISMPAFSQALHLPRMEGQASAEIPLVTYQNGNLNTNGEMAFNIFNGQAFVTNLSMHNPLGERPKLNADLQLRNLDLGSLTRTFSFGAIEGKLDGDISGLEMQNWKPVTFDAKVHSSLGKYAKKISQRAVENISSLGGAGAAAAIQRSVLRFFEQFNYETLGLSCVLRDDVCQMQGVESTAQGYVIVKGSGIPAITVLGYNHTVGWGELLARIQRVIDGNTKATVK